MIVWATALWLFVTPSFAQESPSTEAPPSPTTDVPRPEGTSTTDAPGPEANPTSDETRLSQVEEDADVEARALYRMGTDLLGNGRYSAACGALKELLSDYPESTYASRAAERLSMAASASDVPACHLDPTESTPTRATPPATVSAPPPVTAPPGATTTVGATQPLVKHGQRTGRLELTISQGLIGPALFGGLVPSSLCTGGVCPAYSYLLGGLVGLGAGIGIPLAVTQKFPVSSGQAMLITSGETMGFWNGMTLAAAFPRVWQNPQHVLAIMAGSTVLGGGAGIGAAIGLKPTAGQVSVFRSGFSWGAYFGGISFLVLGSQDLPNPVLRLGLVADTGAIIGAIVGSQIAVSRPRMNLINLSGYAGALGLSMVYGIVALAGSSAPEAWFSVLAVGAAGGIVTGAILTRKMDLADDVAWLGRGTVLGTEGGRLAWGLPLPTPRLAPRGPIGVQLNLARGRF